MVTSLYAGILTILLVALLLNVVRNRWKFKVSLGDGGVAEMTRAIRIHGNFIEIVPILLFLMYLIEVQDTSRGLLHLFGCLIIASRLLHFWGLNQSFFAGRAAGTILAVILMLVGAIANIILYFSF